MFRVVKSIFRGSKVYIGWGIYTFTNSSFKIYKALNDEFQVEPDCLQTKARVFYISGFIVICLHIFVAGTVLGQAVPPKGVPLVIYKFLKRIIISKTIKGSRLKLKAEELQIAAKALQDKATNEKVNIHTQAGTLASSAQTLAENTPPQAFVNADTVIDKFDELEDAYNQLSTSSPVDQAKVEKEFNTVKHIYDTMINVKKAKKLQEQVGTQDGKGGSDQKIWYYANELYGKANILAGAEKLKAPEAQDGEDPTKELKHLAEKLRDAVGQNDNSGLQKALSELSTARESNPKDLIPMAKDVIDKYNSVKEAYEKVKAQASEYTKALTKTGETSKYTNVKSAFQALESAYNLGKCKDITPIFDKEYIDIQTSIVSDRLTSKATEIESKAQALRTTAERQSTTELADNRNNDINSTTNKLGSELPTKATTLKSKAEKLYNAAQRLEETAEDPSPLADLKNHAEELATAAKKDTTSDGLFYAAQALESGGGDSLEDKATKVITKFDKVQRAYTALMTKAKQIGKQGHSEVNSVENEYTELKEHYDGMLNLTKLSKMAKDLTGTLQGPATTLASSVKELRDNTDGNDYPKAQTVIQNYEKVESAYTSLGDKQSVKDKFEALKTLYDKIFKFTKVKYYSEQLEGAADPSGDAEKVITFFNSVVVAYNALGETEQKHVKDQFTELQTEYSNGIYKYKFHILTIPFMVTNWLNFLRYVFMGSWGVYHEKVCKGTGNEQPGRTGCPKPEDSATETVNSIKLELTNSTSDITHKIILNGTGSSGTVSTSKAITLASGGDVTLTINLPGGEIKLSKLTISGTNLTIQGGTSRVSVTKKSNPWVTGTPVKLHSSNGATLTGTTLTINKQDPGGKEATITGSPSGGNVELNYSTGSGTIEISGTAITALEGKFIPDELHDKHKEQKCCIYSKQYTWQDSANTYVVWWNIFNILMPLQICLAAIFIYSLNNREYHSYLLSCSSSNAAG
ncbi:Tpr-related protein family member, putative [Theileria annulata]|uniref:Tpr-related protein family member, putative n=1 Tax=Theileria annulata TaxID=5874 RepID=Q4UFI9_THEAN|nr:Tpr-related protein family member, putative [Theileria annulata]CAI74127.1 Tpr-related protein family member, putative [Theileria annulata]|eukprot:XP_951859.1 Tpr-related protein family member, putative [Theileria annulata]